jgi:hypothetical protein
MCPLDLADDVWRRAGRSPPRNWKSCSMRRGSPRNFPTLPIASKHLAQLRWLVVGEEIGVDPRPKAAHDAALRVVER